MVEPVALGDWMRQNITMAGVWCRTLALPGGWEGKGEVEREGQRQTQKQAEAETHREIDRDRHTH